MKEMVVAVAVVVVVVLEVVVVVVVVSGSFWLRCLGWKFLACTDRGVMGQPCVD